MALSTADREKIAEAYNVSIAIGLTVEVGKNSIREGERGTVIGWQIGSNSEPRYIIQFSNYECISVSTEEFVKNNYYFIG